MNFYVFAVYRNPGALGFAVNAVSNMMRSKQLITGGGNQG